MNFVLLKKAFNIFSPKKKARIMPLVTRQNFTINLILSYDKLKSYTR